MANTVEEAFELLEVSLRILSFKELSPGLPW